MIIRRYIATLCAGLLVAACMGSEEITPSTPATGTGSITVPASGVIDFTGTGALEGITITATAPGRAGAVMTVTREALTGSVDGRTALTDVYAISFDPVGSSVSANITLSVSAAALANADITIADADVYRLSGSTATAVSSTAPDNTTLTATASVPSSFFVGYTASGTAVATSRVTTLSAVGYATAEANGDTVTMPDTATTVVALPVRGIPNVQPGETVILGVDPIPLGGSISSSTWTLTSQPVGSTATLSVSGDNATLVPDDFGSFVVTLAATGANGSSVNETTTIYARAYGPTLTCVSCHDGTYAGVGGGAFGDDLGRNLVAPMDNSSHDNAYASVDDDANSPECFVCHTTGFFFVDVNPTDGVDDFPAVDGYDDLVANFDAMATSTTSNDMDNVGCEACHGPGATEAGNLNHVFTPNYESGTCLSCHDTGTAVAGHFADFGSSHDAANEQINGIVARAEGCFECHSGHGAIAKLKGFDLDPASVEAPVGVTCIVCHDPHGESVEAFALRDNGTVSVTLAAETLDVSAGTSAMCYSCHYSQDALPAVGTKPHNAQAEMYEGKGGYEYDNATVSVTAFHETSNMECVDCHMNRDEGTTHDFDMNNAAASRKLFCESSCHTDTGTTPWFDYSSHTSEIQTLLGDLKTAINTAAGLDPSTGVSADYSGMSLPAATITALNRAAYNYNFITADRSGGAHNYRYAKGLIQLSINDLGSL